MEEARYWTWAKSNPRALAGDSWEEQAFAEDAAGALGGCVWPPRSYSCSFCRRDFRSAQALGGHMNVHRRDRARLKQSPNPAAEVVPERNHALNTCTSQMCTFFFTNPNPKFSTAGGGFRISSPPLPSAVKVVDRRDEEEEKVSSNFCFFSPKKGSLASLNHAPPWSSFLSRKRDRYDEEKSAVANNSESRVEREDLNLVVGQWETDTCSDEEVARFKRRRIDQAKPLKLCSAADDLDLELRLGDAPKVK